jgi:hypothetical protein
MADSLISSGNSNQDGAGQTAVNDQITDSVTQANTGEMRPEWLPENFWVDGKPNYENLAKSYSEIRAKFGSKEEDLRTKLLEELSNEAVANRPEAPEKYELPEIDGANYEQMANHPLTKWWSEFAFENGFDQDTFKEGISRYIEARISDVPNYEVEMKVLGDNASARTEAVGLWVNKNFNETERSQIEKLCGTAEGVKVMEKVMSMLKDGGSSSAFEPPPEVTDKDIQKMMMDRRYWSTSDRDPAYVAKVEGFFKKKYG